MEHVATPAVTARASWTWADGRSALDESYPLSVSGSVRMTAAFYERLLGERSSLEQAFLAARAALAGDAMTLDWASVQFYARAADGTASYPIPLPRPVPAEPGPVPETAPPRRRWPAALIATSGLLMVVAAALALHFTLPAGNEPVAPATGATDAPGDVTADSFPIAGKAGATRREPTPLTAHEAGPIAFELVSQTMGKKWLVAVSSHRTARIAAKELYLKFLLDDPTAHAAP